MATRRLNTTHKKILEFLRRGPANGTAIAIGTQTRIRDAETALRALRRTECVEVAEGVYTLTPRGLLLAKSLYAKERQKLAMRGGPAR